MAKLLTSKSTVLVYEQGLSTGSGELSDGDASNNSDIREAGIRTLSSTGGTGPYTYSLISSAVGTYGTLSLDSATGIYTYILATRYDTSPDADNGLNTEVAGDTFSYMVTDATGQSATATIRVNVVDDVPTARPNTSSATGVEINEPECKLENDYGHQTVKTPATVAVRRSSEDRQITCVKPGETDGRDIAISRATGGMAGSILLGGGIGAIINHNKCTACTYP